VLQFDSVFAAGLGAIQRSVRKIEKVVGLRVAGRQ
jgi:hypothetical protein